MLILIFSASVTAFKCSIRFVSVQSRFKFKSVNLLLEGDSASDRTVVEAAFDDGDRRGRCTREKLFRLNK
jgi:hypothetical protein